MALVFEPIAKRSCVCTGAPWPSRRLPATATLLDWRLTWPSTKPTSPEATAVSAWVLSTAAVSACSESSDPPHAGRPRPKPLDSNSCSTERRRKGEEVAWLDMRKP